MIKSTNLDRIKKIIDFIEKDNIDAALPEFRKLIRYTGKFTEDEIEEIYKFGRLFKKEPIKSESDKFISEIDKSIRGKKHENLYFIKSEIVANAWDKETALASIKEALKKYPRNTELFNSKARILKDLKRYDEALTVIEKAIDLEPKNTTYLNRKTLILKDLKRYDEALTVIEKAIDLEPKNSRNINNKAQILKNLKRYDEALTVIKKAIDLEPKNSRYINNKALILEDLKRYDEALTVIEKAIEIEPDNAEYLVIRAIIFLNLGKYEPAIEDIEKASEIEPENPTYISMLTTLRLQQQIKEQFKESKKEIEDIKKQSEVSKKDIEYTKKQSKKDTEDINKQSKESRKEINILKDDLEKNTNDQEEINEDIKQINENLQDNKVKIIEFLGIFTAIISFTVVAMTTTKSHSLPNSLIIIFGLGLTLIAFVLAIDAIISNKPKKNAIKYLILIIFAILAIILISYDINGYTTTCGTGTIYDLNWKACVPDPDSCNLLTADSCIHNSNCRIVSAKGSPGCPECIDKIKRCFPK